jgi:hypothetical protein
LTLLTQEKQGWDFFGECFVMGKWKWDWGCFFQLNAGNTQLNHSSRPSLTWAVLKLFYNESKNDIPSPIVMEDGAPVHKGVRKKPREDIPIENIWGWMKHEITTTYMYVTSKAEMKRELQRKCGKILEMISGMELSQVCRKAVI